MKKIRITLAALFASSIFTMLEAGPGQGDYRGAYAFERFVSQLRGIAEVTNPSDPGAMFGTHVRVSSRKGSRARLQELTVRKSLDSAGAMSVHVNGRIGVRATGRSLGAARKAAKGRDYLRFRISAKGPANITGTSFSMKGAPGKIGRTKAKVNAAASSPSTDRLLLTLDLRASKETSFGKRLILRFEGSK